MDSEDQITIVKNEAARRYELSLNGAPAGLADYHLQGGVVVIPHTETAPQYGGRGLASRLVKFALDDIAAQGLKVDPVCPFVAVYIQRHPEYAALLA